MTPAPAKEGQLAPFDIVVPKGPTPFGPGPIIGELQKIGLPAAIEAGKIGIHTFTNASAFSVADVDTKIISIEFLSGEEASVL